MTDLETTAEINETPIEVAMDLEYKDPRKEIETVEFEGYKLSYRRAGFTELPYLIQWIIEGFAPTFLSKEKLDTMTTDEQFEEALKYLTGAYQTFSEEQQAKLWGSATYASKASITYLFPAVQRCFPDFDLHELKDEIIDFCVTKVITDYFNSIAESNSGNKKS